MSGGLRVATKIPTTKTMTTPISSKAQRQRRPKREIIRQTFEGLSESPQASTGLSDTFAAYGFIRFKR
jgi:hypothetical protein